MKNRMIKAIIDFKVSTLIDISIQYYTLCLCSEIKYTPSYFTPISALIFLGMIITKYITFINEACSKSKKDILKFCLLTFFNDFRKFILCILFFIEDECYILIVVPVILQIVFLCIVLICNDIKQRNSKVIVVVNESATIIFCILCTFTYNCAISSYNMSQIIGVIFAILLTAILGFEILILLLQFFCNIKILIKLRRSKRITPRSEVLDLSKYENNNSFGTPVKKKLRSSCVTNKKSKLKLELNSVSEAKEASLKIEDIENSMHNICEPVIIQRVKKERRESKPIRLEDSKYFDYEANEEDIIPKIEIARPDFISFANINNKSFLSANAIHNESDQLSSCHNSQINQTPKSARYNLNENPRSSFKSAIDNSEILHPRWKVIPKNATNIRHIKQSINWSLFRNQK